MTATEDIDTSTAPTTDALRDSVRAIGVEIDRRSAELSGSCRVPDDLGETIARQGLFRQLVPRELGGVGATPAEWFTNGVELASHDASVGWVVTQGAAELGWIATGGDPAWAAEVLANPLASSASTIAGLGTLTVDGDTGILEGRWAFNTGCHGATWIGGMSVVLPAVDGEEPDLLLDPTSLQCSAGSSSRIHPRGSPWAMPPQRSSLASTESTRASHHLPLRAPPPSC
ncbi:MAG: acyl-CoA dehydrogenase family protein [Acidimicrobiales bacterium]